jgi:hypothetical protein
MIEKVSSKCCQLGKAQEGDTPENWVSDRGEDEQIFHMDEVRDFIKEYPDAHNKKLASEIISNATLIPCEQTSFLQIFKIHKRGPQPEGFLTVQRCEHNIKPVS